MRVVDPGHLYELDMLNGSTKQILCFDKRVGDEYLGNYGLPYPGTNCQEVLRALIDRMTYLNGQVPCAETEAAISLAQTMLLLFEMRAARRKGRGLELRSIEALRDSMTCRVCGHIACQEHHP